MKTNIRALGILLFLCVFGLTSVQAQQHFATIKKNYNVLAESLKHELNSSRDTLVLQSEKPILRVYTVGDFGGLIDVEVNDYQQRIPLQNLRKGKYVFVVDQPKLKIVFQVLVHRNGKDYRAIRKRVATTDDVRKSQKARSSGTIRTAKAVSTLKTEEVAKVVQTDVSALKTESDQNGKAYNLTDLERQNMQSRDEAKKIKAYEREAKLKARAVKSETEKIEPEL